MLTAKCNDLDARQNRVESDLLFLLKEAAYLRENKADFGETNERCGKLEELMCDARELASSADMETTRMVRFIERYEPLYI